jgi:hypothetical protein
MPIGYGLTPFLRLSMGALVDVLQIADLALTFS